MNSAINSAIHKSAVQSATVQNGVDVVVSGGRSVQKLPLIF